MSGLVLSDIHVSYGGRKILNGLSLPELKPGEVTVLAGPNAAGKSTLLRAVAQLLPAKGRMQLESQELGEMRPAARAAKMGFMPQSLPGAAGLSVLESVIAALRAAGSFPAAGADARAMAMLDRLGIGALALSNLDRLSGGQRQMVGLAQALVRDPLLLLLDEPTSALDLARQVRLMSAVRAQAAEGRVVLVVLHDLGLAARWADRIAVLQQGALYACGTPAEVLTPQMLAEVYGVAARVERCSQGHPIVLIDGELPKP